MKLVHRTQTFWMPLMIEERGCASCRNTYKAALVSSRRAMLRKYESASWRLARGHFMFCWFRGPHVGTA